MRSDGIAAERTSFIPVGMTGSAAYVAAFEAVDEEAGRGAGAGAGAGVGAGVSTSATVDGIRRDVAPTFTSAVESLAEYNASEFQLIDRLYAAIENAMIGPKKDLEVVMSIVVDNSYHHILMREYSIRTADLHLEQQLLEAKRRFLYTKLEQFNAYFKKAEAKQTGVMFSLVEMQQRMQLAIRQTLNTSFQEFLTQALSQKKRWVMTHSASGAAAETIWTSVLADEHGVHSLLDVATVDMSKMDLQLKRNFEHFRTRLNESIKKEVPAIPEAFLIREYRPLADFKRRPEKAAMSTSREWVRERHIEFTAEMRVEKHPEYSEHLIEHIKKLNAAIEHVDSVIASLISETPAHESASIVTNDSRAAEKQIAIAWQKAQDSLVIQQAIRYLLIMQKQLIYSLTKSESFMPIAPTRLEATALCDPITTTELRFRMLTPLNLIIENEKRVFKKFCRANLAYDSEMSASGATLWSPTSSDALLDRYVADFAGRLQGILEPLMEEWETWDISEVDLLDVTPALLKTIQGQVEIKRQTVLGDIKKLDREIGKIAYSMQRYERLKRLLTEQKLHLHKTRIKRFEIMLGEQITAYKAARERGEAHFFNLDSFGDRILKDYTDASLLATYFPEARLAKIEHLLTHGIPLGYSGKQVAGSNLLHLALSNLSEHYDATLVAIVQYLLKREVNAAQLNADGVSPSALVRMRLEAVISVTQPWVKQAEAIQALCNEAAALTLLKLEDYRSLKGLLNFFVEKARALIVDEETRIQPYEGRSGLALFRCSFVKLELYEDALCASQQNLYGLFAVLFKLPTFEVSSTHPFTKSFIKLINALSSQEVVKRLLVQIALVKEQQQKQLALQVALAHASVRAELAILRHHLAAANCRLEESERKLRAAEAELGRFNPGFFGSGSESHRGTEAAVAGAGTAAEETVNGCKVAASC